MKIVVLSSPSRFPTVVHDPGAWWSTVANQSHELVWHQANTAWWRTLCSPAAQDMILQPLGFTRRLRRQVEWKAAGVDLKRSGAAAGRSLEALRTPLPYQSATSYVATIGPIAAHLANWNAAQEELHCSLEQGVRAVGLNCDDSASIVEYAIRDGTLLSMSIKAALADCPREIDLLVVSATSAENLLCAMIAMRHLRGDNPRMHVCLADHGYENFSLQPHFDRLGEGSPIAAVFDTIITVHNDRDAVLPWLVEELAAGRNPRGILTRNLLQSGGEAANVAAYRPPPPPPTFSGEPVLWTRISGRRCYWGRCAFCVQNNKYDDVRIPSVQEVASALDRIEAMIAAGYRTFIFSDEALPPALIRRLCDGILRRNLSLHWTCRAKVEASHDRELFGRMRQAGCCEVLYGLESISPRMQERMCKCAKALTPEQVGELLHDMSEVGLGMHVNLLGCFPGDTPQEVAHTVDFLVKKLQKADRTTFTLNRFALFPGTAVSQNAADFGVTVHEPNGDIPSRLEYSLLPDLQADSDAIDRMLPEMRERLLGGLGWRGLGSNAAAEAAISLYFDSGHGALFKKQPEDPFAAVRRRHNAR